MPIDTLFAVRQTINIIIKNKNVYLQKKQAMLVTVLKSKIHRVIVTESNIDYIGSITPQHVSGRVYKVENGDGCGKFCLWFLIIDAFIIFLYWIISGGH